MNRLPAIAAVLLLGSTPAFSETVRVLSGEHGEFTRIVLVFKAPVSWNVMNEPSGHAIQFDRRDISLDLSRVYDRIGKDRISDIAFDRSDGILLLRSNCDCVVDIFRAGRNTVAIDVKRNPVQTSTSVATLEHDYLPFGLPFSPTPSSTSNPAAARDLPPVPVDRLRDLQPLEEALVEQFARAASQGLLDVATPPPSNLSAPAPPPVPRITPAPEVAAAPESPVISHLRSHTALDLAFPGISAAPEPTLSAVCPDPSYLDPSTWATLDDPFEAISAARLGLVDPLDRPQPKQIEALALAYLRFGFGAEANAVLREFPNSAQYPGLLSAVGDIMDYGVPTEPQTLQRLAYCDGPYPLWALLAQRSPDGGGDFDTRTIEQWFFRMPAILRAHLGPTLVARLQRAGETDSARVIRDATVRANVGESQELAVLEGSTSVGIDLAPGQREELEAIVARGGIAAGPALIEVLRRGIAVGSVSQDQVVLAESLAFESGASEIAGSLLEQAVAARALLGDLSGALSDYDALNEIAPDRPFPDPVLSSVFLQGARSQDDAALLIAGEWLSRTRNVAHLSEPAALAAADRMLVLNLPDPAGRLLEPLRDSPKIEIRQILARTALRRADPALALATLAGETDPASRAIRAAALEQLGNYDKASALFEEIALTQEAERTAWLSGNAAAVERLGSEAERDFMERRAERRARHPTEFDVSAVEVSADWAVGNATGDLTPSPPAPVAGGSTAAPRPSLTASRDLVTESSDTRAAILALLAETASTKE